MKNNISRCNKYFVWGLSNLMLYILTISLSHKALAVPITQTKVTNKNHGNCTTRTYGSTVVLCPAGDYIVSCEGGLNVRCVQASSAVCARCPDGGSIESSIAVIGARWCVFDGWPSSNANTNSYDHYYTSVTLWNDIRDCRKTGKVTDDTGTYSWENGYCSYSL